VKQTTFLSPALVAEVERRAAAAGRSLDLEYGRLLALGLLAKLAEELSPLFPELVRQRTALETQDGPKVAPRTVPDEGVAAALASRSIPGAGSSEPAYGYETT
jgi:hypothetical protein